MSRHATGLGNCRVPGSGLANRVGDGRVEQSPNSWVDSWVAWGELEELTFGERKACCKNGIEFIRGQLSFPGVKRNFNSYFHTMH